MYIKFISQNKVAVSKSHHVDEALKYFGETLRGNLVNPATSQLSTITSEANDLDAEKRALSLDNHQNLVNHESFTAIIGKRGVFYMHKGAVSNQGRLGET